MEGYEVWVDKQGKWHTSHQYILGQFDLDELFSSCSVVQAWQIPLPVDLLSIHHWFSRQRAKEAFRGKALRIAQKDFQEHSLVASTDEVRDE